MTVVGHDQISLSLLCDHWISLYPVVSDWSFSRSMFDSDRVLRRFLFTLPLLELVSEVLSSSTRNL